jgi:hypothetical protein
MTTTPPVGAPGPTTAAQGSGMQDGKHGPTDDEPWKKGLKDFLKGASSALALLVVVGLVAGVYVWLGQEPTKDICAAPDAAGSGETSATEKADGPVTPTVPEGALTSFTLGTDLNSGPRSVPFTLSGPIVGSRNVKVAPGLFADPTDGRQFSSGEVKTWATVDQAGTSGVVTFCIPAGERENGPWGTFAGSIVFEDDRITSTPINVTVSGSDPNRQAVFLAWVIVCLLASCYVLFLRDQATAQDKDTATAPALRWDFLFFRRYWKYMTAPIGVITIFAGCAAAFAVAQSQYLRGTAWAGSIPEWMAFCGAAGAAFVAGSTAGRLAGNKYANPLADTPTEGQSDTTQQ